MLRDMTIQPNSVWSWKAAPVEGRWVDRVVGLNDVRADIAMMRTPDGLAELC